MKYPAKLSLILLLFIFSTGSTYAQDAVSSGIATYVPISTTVHEGDIIRLTKNGYDLTHNAYDSTTFGVVTQNPSVSFENTNLSNGKPVISSGKVYVRVSTINGQIKKGDLITTSSIPGVGQKATNEGYIIGTALQDYTSEDPKAIGKVLLILNITFNTSSSTTKTNLLSGFQNILTAPYLSPLNTLRYLFAAILVIASFIMAISFFGRVSSLGIEAIGRNPLASKAILAGVILHIVLAGLIIFLGVGVAYLILVI